MSDGSVAVEAEAVQEDVGGEYAGTRVEQVSIGGWLVLPLLGLIVSPFFVARDVYANILPIFADGTWLALMSPTSELYHPLWAPLIVFEIIGNLTVVGLGLIALWYFVKRSRVTPRLMVCWYLTVLLAVVVDLILSRQIPLIVALNDPSSFGQVVRSVVVTLIWVPYFLVSKRVKATFVN